MTLAHGITNIMLYLVVPFFFQASVSTIFIKTMTTNAITRGKIPTPPATRTPPVMPVNWPVVYGVVVALAVIGSLLFFLTRRSHTKSS